MAIFAGARKFAGYVRSCRAPATTHSLAPRRQHGRAVSGGPRPAICRGRPPPAIDADAGGGARLCVRGAGSAPGGNPECSTGTTCAFFSPSGAKGRRLPAARDLGVNQTTVARRVDALEHDLGMMLFERRAEGYRLTPQGRDIVAFAEKRRSGDASARRCRRSVETGSRGRRPR